ESGSMTQAGQVLGTPTYMSPEQARCEKTDGQSDIFAFGIMFYEMLTGVLPYQAENMLATLLARTQAPPPPPITVRPELPEGLNHIVMRCLQIRKELRYQSAREALVDLDFVVAGLGGEMAQLLNPLSGMGAGSSYAAPSVMQSVALPSMMQTAALRSMMISGAPGAASIPPQGAVTPPRVSRRWMIYGGATAAATLAGAGWLVKDKFFGGPVGPAKSVTLLVADFANETGDPVFDGALEPTFTFAVEGAGFVSAFNRSTARNLVSQVQPGSTRLTEATARLVAVREGISVIVGGTIRKKGSGYELSIRATDALTGKSLMDEEKASGDREKILAAAGKLAVSVRKTLGDTTPESAQIAASETFTASSLEAAQAYSKAQEARFAGKAEDAIKLYQEAIRLDPNLATAYSALGVTYANLGQRGVAESYYKQALAHIEKMSEREKFRTRGAYYLTALNHEKAVEEFRLLAKNFPVDTAGLSNLAYVEYLRRDMPRALESGKKALDVYPKNALLRSNYAMYAM
ncbi:MAG TPA: protein kinase family protein, partial [Gemmatimonadales bacterium]|nr:protein kinase family protein [Gemmatimonadales bacterium]